jgi:hypothetical protein
MNLPPRRPGTLSLVGCARCKGFLAVEPQTLPSERSGAWVYCAECKPIVGAEQAARPCVPGARAVHVDYQRGPFADMVVREVDGDRVKISRLGCPDGVPAGAHAFHPPTMGRVWFTRGELIMQGM